MTQKYTRSPVEGANVQEIYPPLSRAEWRIVSYQDFAAGFAKLAAEHVANGNADAAIEAQRNAAEAHHHAWERLERLINPGTHA